MPSGEAIWNTLQAVTVFSLLANNIEDRINKLGTLGVVTFSPVVASTRLTKNKVIWAKDLAIGGSSNTVHGARLQIHEDCTRHKSPAAGLIVVHIHPLQLQLGVTDVSTCGVDSMLITDHFPELGTNLVSTLATLNMKNLSHLLCLLLLIGSCF